MKSRMNLQQGVGIGGYMRYLIRTKEETYHKVFCCGFDVYHDTFKYSACFRWRRRSRPDSGSVSGGQRLYDD